VKIKRVLVTTEFRGVFFGYVKDDEQLPDEITLTAGEKLHLLVRRLWWVPWVSRWWSDKLLQNRYPGSRAATIQDY